MSDKSLYAELYDYLEGFEQTERIDIFEQIVNEWSEEQVEDFIMETFRRIPSDSFQKRSYYNFYANSTLAGAPFPCSAIECRMSNVADLLRFLRCMRIKCYCHHLLISMLKVLKMEKELTGWIWQVM